MLREMQVMGIAIDTRTGSPIVVLQDKDNLDWFCRSQRNYKSH